MSVYICADVLFAPIFMEFIKEFITTIILCAFKNALLPHIARIHKIYNFFHWHFSRQPSSTTTKKMMMTFFPFLMTCSSLLSFRRTFLHFNFWLTFPMSKQTKKVEGIITACHDGRSVLLLSNECGLTSIHFVDDVLRTFNFSSVVYGKLLMSFLSSSFFFRGFDDKKYPGGYNTSQRHDLVNFIEYHILTKSLVWDEFLPFNWKHVNVIVATTYTHIQHSSNMAIFSIVGKQYISTMALHLSQRENIERLIISRIAFHAFHFVWAYLFSFFSILYTQTHSSYLSYLIYWNDYVFSWWLIISSTSHITHHSIEIVFEQAQRCNTK